MVVVKNPKRSLPRSHDLVVFQYFDEEELIKVLGVGYYKANSDIWFDCLKPCISHPSAKLTIETEDVIGWTYFDDLSDFLSECIEREEIGDN